MVRVGIVGFGNHMRKSLLPNLIGTEGLQIIAVADIAASRRKLATELLIGVQVFADASELFANAEVEAVLISADPDSHVELARQALRGGKHVFVEKPLGTDPALIEELATLADDVDRALMVGTMWRHAPAHRLIDNWLAERATEPTSISISATFPAVLVRPGWAGSERDLAFWDMFIHPIDWVLGLLGPVRDVRAQEIPTQESGRVDCVLTLVDMNGHIATLTLSTASNAYQVATWIHTEDGSVIEVDTKERLRITSAPTWSGTEGWIRDRPTLNWEPGQLYRGWGRQGYAEELREFAAQAGGANEGGTSARSSAETSRVIRRCLEALASFEQSPHESEVNDD